MIKYRQTTVTAGNGIKRGLAIEKKKSNEVQEYYINTWHFHLKITERSALINEKSFLRFPAGWQKTYVASICHCYRWGN